MNSYKTQRITSLGIESLEKREVPAYANVVRGVLQVVGDNWSNDAVVQMSGSNVVVTIDSTPANGFSLVPDHVVKSFPKSSINEVRFWGYEGNDSFKCFANIKCAYVNGGTGVDSIYIPNALGRVVNCEAVEVDVPGGSPQSRNTCGPNSAWRVMQAHGGAATIQQVIDSASERSVVSKWNLGTTGATLVKAMNNNPRGLGDYRFSLLTKSSLDRLVDFVKEGRPVVAQIRVPGTEVYKIGGIFGGVRYEIPALHWVAVDGVDSAKRLIFYTDTDGNRYQKSYDSFNSAFNWNFGTVQNTLLQGFGVVRSTFIV